MVYALGKAGYARVRARFAPLRFHLASAAVLDGNNPGFAFDEAGHRSAKACYAGLMPV
ncbi:MAG: hypothetical protein Kow00120_30670 [Anaerolineae bacterium]